MKVIFTTHKNNLHLNLKALQDWKIVELNNVLDKAARINAGHVTVTIENVKRPRTTGKHSQNACINGYIQQICMEYGYEFADVKMYMKELALSRGYPFMRDEDGNVVTSIKTGDPLPASETVITTIEAGYLIETIQQFAAEHGIILRDE